MREYKTSEKVFGIIFIVWFIVSFIFVLAPPSIYALFVDLGQYFLIFGIIFLFGNKSKKKKITDAFLFLPIIIGISFIGITLLFFYKVQINIIISIIIGIAFSIFVFVGFILIGDFVNKRKKLKSDNYVLTYGKIIGLNDSVTDKGKKVYAPIIEYTFGGRNYTYESNSYSNVGVPLIGDIIDIKINPQEPEEIIFKESGEWIGLVIGILFIVAIVFALICMYIFNE